MKNYLIASIALATTLFCSCEKLSKLTQFDMKHSCESTIEAGVATSLPFDVITPEVTTQSESEFKGHNTSANLVQSVKLKQMKLKITSPGNRTFDFLNDIELYLSADGEEEILVAWKHNISDAVGTELLLDAGTEELKSYLVKDKYKLRLKITTDKTINEDVHVTVSSVFRVDANVLGL